MSVHLFTVSEDAAAGVEANRVRLVSSGAPVSLTVNSSGGGGGAVDSVNGQTGVVVLDAADVGAATAAQGTKADTAVQPGDLATVATTGAYADLIDKPTLGTAAAAATTDFATAAQGAKADTAVQPADLTPYATDADITALIGAAPAALNTLSELADALGDDANFAATVTTALAGKQPLDADLTAIAALVTTAYGRGFLTLADQAALVALLPSYQPLDADLTALAAAGNSATLAATTAAFTTADETKLDGIEAGADVTDATNVSAAGAVMESDYDANTILAATADNTPTALTVGASRIVGRKATGDIAAMTGAETYALLTRTREVWYSVPGTLTTGGGAVRIPFPRAATITNVAAVVGTAPTGAAILVDVNKNGTTIFTTQGNRPNIAVSTNADNTSTPDVTSIAANDYLTVDIDQIGSTVAGSDLTVRIDYTEAG